MEELGIDRIIEDSFGGAAYMIQAVARRGIIDEEIEVDDFTDLLSRREFQDVVIGELYEAYFLPKRHEFDWQVIHEIVSIMTSERLKEFYAVAALGGVIGNASYAALSMLLRRVVTEMKSAKLLKVRQDPFSAMEKDVRQIESFFRAKPCARIAEIEEATGVERERVYPLLKLLGFTHCRRLHSCYWCCPGARPPEIARNSL